MTTKKLLQIQILVLTIGTIFAYTTVFIELRDFYAIEGAIFKFQDCSVTNPMLTPCFFGAFGFLISLLWSIAIYKKEEIKDKLSNQKNLLYLLVGGTIFAWGNTFLLMYRFFFIDGIIPCGVTKPTNPFQSACFIGASLFLLGLISGIASYKKMVLKKNK